MSPGLFVAISSHGLGHLSQVAPVVNALADTLPGLRLTVQSGLPAGRLGLRIHHPFELVAEAPDVGMLMDGPLTVLAEESLRAHQRFHADWERRLERQSALYEAVRPDLILADVPYLPLVAAQQVGIPSVALCSINWAGILSAYCQDSATEPILRVMLDAYASARLFIRPEPSMPMPELAGTRPVGPIAALGTDRSGEILDRLGLGKGVRLALVSFGGIDLTIETPWPSLPDTHWILPGDWGLGRDDCHGIESLGLPFIDLLRSVDLLITKPGYGAFTEVTCNGTAVVYTARPDWPESAYLEDWLHRHGRARRMPMDRLLGGGLSEAVAALLDEPVPPVPAPTGIAEAADLLVALLGR